MSSPTDKPLARAQAHLASARYAEAAGAFRAVLHIDPLEFQAHFGLADALVARGQRDEAIEGLVSAAETCVEAEAHAAALTLYGKALAIDPGRLELHLDVAIAEAALGRDDAAQARLENLGEIYMQAGRTDEAAEVFRFLASWDEEEVEEEEAPAAPPASSPMQQTAVPTQLPTTETVVVPTILVTPDGQLLQMPIDRQASEPVPVSKDPTVPPVPRELIEAAHSKPIDLAPDSQIENVEGTVVAFPPPPPELPEDAKTHPPGASREDLEAALAAAMENLELVEQLQEEEETLVMKVPLLPPRKKKIIARSDPGADGRLRLDRAPRPKSAAPAKGAPPARPRAQTPVPGRAPAPAKGPAPSAPAQGAAPARPRAQTPVPGRTPAPARAASPPSRGRPSTPGRPRANTPAPLRAGPVKAAPPKRANPGPPPKGRPRGPAPKAAAPGPKPGGPKPTRPDNPLVERLRRRAGLGKEGRPRSSRARATEPISVGRATGRGRPGPDSDSE